MSKYINYSNLSKGLKKFNSKKPFPFAIVDNFFKKSIANFNLREGMRVGMKVTLRKSRMWDFVDRLLNIALPRVRDFRGVSKNSFDGRGNYTLGITEQVIFPEIEYNQIDKIRGFQVTIGTTSINDEEARRLLELLGMPFFRSNNWIRENKWLENLKLKEKRK